jgi:hypothetical protein
MDRLVLDALAAFPAQLSASIATFADFKRP